MSISASISASVGSTPIIDRRPSEPVNIDPPVLSGDFLVGNVVACSEGTWTNDPFDFQYQWYRDSVEITEANRPEYKLTGDDRGTTISCLVTATNDFGSGFRYSNEVFINR